MTLRSLKRLDDTPTISRDNPSVPIEIPTRRRPIVSPLTSPVERQFSPDLLFEMSPVTSEFSPSTNHHFKLSTSSIIRDHEPFMYTVPSFSDLRPSNSGSHPPRRGVPYGLADVMPAEADRSNQHISRTTFRQPTNYSVYANPWSKPSSPGVVKSTPTTKISGFLPINQNQPPMTNTAPRSTERLSPTPRRSSYSSSPWILPGKEDSQEGDLAYSETDSGALDFQAHMLRRFEKQNPSQGFRSYL